MTMRVSHRALITRSLRVIRAGQAATGAYVAAPAFPTYHFSWFRDGSFIADAMSRCGSVDSAEAFFDWCAKILTDRSDRIRSLVLRGESDPTGVDAAEQLHTRYTLDGVESPTDWENFQLDGYGTWLWSLDAHLRRHGLGRDAYLPAVTLTLDYLTTFWAAPCYDWWEENGDGRHPSTLGAIRAGLTAVGRWEELDPERRQRVHRAARAIDELVASQGVVDGHLTKSLGTSAIDGSLLACIEPFGLYPVDHPVARRTIAEVESQLAPAGVHRFAADTYYGGGQWILLAALLGWQHVAAGNPARARELLDWIAGQADAELDLPEQVDDAALHPERIGEWVDRWGPSARPLLWSHAMYLTLAHELGLTGGGDDDLTVTTNREPGA